MVCPESKRGRVNHPSTIKIANMFCLLLSLYRLFVGGFHLLGVENRIGSYSKIPPRPSANTGNKNKDKENNSEHTVVWFSMTQTTQVVNIQKVSYFHVFLRVALNAQLKTYQILKKHKKQGEYICY